MEAKIAYSYIRFSRELQARGDSFRRQLANTRAYCARHEMVLDESLDLQDLGVSAFRGRNAEKGALSRFIEACKQGRIKRGSALVVENLDRLSRQSPRRAVALLTQLLDEYGIEIHVTSMGKVFRPDSDSQEEGIDMLLAVAFAIRAHEESETKSRRLREVWANKRKRAAEAGTFMRQDLPWWLVKENEKIVCPPDRAAVLKKVFQLTAAGHSSAQVARMLNTQGCPTWRPQKRWTAVRVRSVVRSRGPQGILQATQKTVAAGRGYELSGYYPVVISDALAASARAVLIRNTRGNRGRIAEHNRPLNVFRGLLHFRGQWARHVTIRNGTPDPETGLKTWNGYYSACEEESRKTLFSISAKQLEPVVFAGLAELKAADLAPEVANAEQTKLEILDGEILALEEKQNNLLRAVESGSTAVAARLLEVEQELAAKQKERERQKGLLTPVHVQRADFKAIVDNLQDRGTRERAAVALRRLVARIDVTRKLDELPLPTRLASRVFRHRSSVVAGAHIFPDPVKADRRRRPLHILVTFANGVARYIGRVAEVPDRLVSWRVEAD